MEGSWHDRKSSIREAYLKTLSQSDPTMAVEVPPTPPTPGNAAGTTVTEAARFVLSVGPPPASIDTSATATVTSTIPSDRPGSSTLAESTKLSSGNSTVWTVSPLGFVEQNMKSSIVDPSGSLTPGLPDSVQASLSQLAIARDEPIHEVIQQIAEFFIEEEDERAEGTMAEMLAFYVENWM